MTDIYQQIQAALKHVEPTRSSKMYRIRNNDGLIFSIFNGWQKSNSKLNGHCFDNNAIDAISKILKEHGYTDITIEIDKTATNFVRMADSPFGNPAKMVKLLIVTVIVFILLFVILDSGFYESISNLLLQNSSQK